MRFAQICHSREACPRESGERESSRSVLKAEVAFKSYSLLKLLSLIILKNHKTPLGV